MTRTKKDQEKKETAIASRAKMPRRVANVHGGALEFKERFEADDAASLRFRVRVPTTAEPRQDVEDACHCIGSSPCQRRNVRRLRLRLRLRRRGASSSSSVSTRRKRPRFGPRFRSSRITAASALKSALAPCVDPFISGVPPPPPPPPPPIFLFLLLLLLLLSLLLLSPPLLCFVRRDDNFGE